MYFAASFVVWCRVRCRVMSLLGAGAAFTLRYRKGHRLRSRTREPPAGLED